MSLFADPKSEDRMCAALKALVEEWGPEHVAVYVPEVWKGLCNGNTIGAVPLCFHSEMSVEIRVRYKGADHVSYVEKVVQQ